MMGWLRWKLAWFRWRVCELPVPRHGVSKGTHLANLVVWIRKEPKRWHYP